MPARLLPYGDRAVLVEVDDLHQALRLHEQLLSGAQVTGLVDLVAGARTVLLVADSPLSLPAVRSHAQRAVASPAVASDEALPEAHAETLSDAFPERGLDGDRGLDGNRVIEVPVHYDGDDLDEVASLTGLTRDEVVAAHTGTPWRVGFAGFAPGFAYLVDGDPRLRVPRRATPRPRVPAGAVGLADEFSGIYPRQSPGGWQLLGHTDLALWDLDREPPALLRPGCWVRFTDADAP